MWEYVQRKSANRKPSNVNESVNYFDLSEEDKVDILNSVLGDTYEIYKRNVADTIEIMVYNAELKAYHDEEQFGYLNIINFWNDVVVEKVSWASGNI